MIQCMKWPLIIFVMPNSRKKNFSNYSFKLEDGRTVHFRLVAADTVEQKILAMQKDKAALANAVVQEESLASVLDLDSLRAILA